MKTVYELDAVRVRIGSAEIIKGISLTLQDAKLTAIVGPNGAGKSTLMSVLSGVRDEYEGRCRFHATEMSDWRKGDLGRRLSFIPQNVRIEFPFTAEQVVFMGRTPHCHGLFETAQDRDAVHRAMEMTETLPFASRDFRALSGGERQRVILAGALAQEPAVLLLDEPTTFLDLKHQISTYVLLEKLARDGICVVAVTHDLNLAASYSDRIVVLSDGGVAADGAPSEVVTTKVLSEVFEVDAEIRSGSNGCPWVSYEQPMGAREQQTW